MHNCKQHWQWCESCIHFFEVDDEAPKFTHAKFRESCVQMRRGRCKARRPY